MSRMETLAVPFRLLQDTPARLQALLKFAARTLRRPLATDRAHAELLSLVVAVCLAVFVTKTVLASFALANPEMRPQIYGDNLLTSLGRVAACCAEDVAVALGCLLLGGFALRCGSGARYRRTLRIGVYAAAVVALLLL